jgi:hypothetical protein
MPATNEDIPIACTETDGNESRLYSIEFGDPIYDIPIFARFSITFLLSFMFIADSKVIKRNVNVNFSVSEVRRDWGGGGWGEVGCGGKGWTGITRGRGGWGHEKKGDKSSS